MRGIIENDEKLLPRRSWTVFLDDGQQGWEALLKRSGVWRAGIWPGDVNVSDGIERVANGSETSGICLGFVKVTGRIVLLLQGAQEMGWLLVFVSGEKFCLNRSMRVPPTYLTLSQSRDNYHSRTNEVPLYRSRLEHVSHPSALQALKKKTDSKLIQTFIRRREILIRLQAATAGNGAAFRFPKGVDLPSISVSFLFSPLRKEGIGRPAFATTMLEAVVIVPAL